jgi:hypothetical protein
MSTRAKFKLCFEVEAYFNITEEMEVILPNCTKIILPKSKVKNFGTLFYEIDKPDTRIAMVEGKDKVENFFTCLLYTRDRYGSLKPITFPKKPELINEEEFAGQGITDYLDLPASFVIVNGLKQEELNDTSELLGKIFKCSSAEIDTITRSMRWFRKASELDGEDQFLHRWISFEALLGLLNMTNSTPALSNIFINYYLNIKTAQKIFNSNQKVITDLSKAGLFGYRGAKYSEDLALSLKNNDPIEILSKANLCVYEVRNKLLHKGEVLNFIADSSSLLNDIIKGCLKDYVNRISK